MIIMELLGHNLQLAMLLFVLVSVCFLVFGKLSSDVKVKLLNTSPDAKQAMSKLTAYGTVWTLSSLAMMLVAIWVLAEMMLEALTK